MVPEPTERSSEEVKETLGADKLWGQIKDGFKNPGGALCVPIRKVTTKVTPPWLAPSSIRSKGPEGPEAAESLGVSSGVTLEADAQQSQALVDLINHAISHREALLKEDPNAGGHLSVISASDLREALLKEAADQDTSAGESGEGAMPKLGVATMGSFLSLASRPPDEEREEPVPETALTAGPVIGGLHAATLTATPKAASTLPGMTPFSPFVPHEPPTFAGVSSLPAAVPLSSAGDDDKISFTYSYDEEEPGLARAGSAATPLSSSRLASDCAPAPRLHAAPRPVVALLTRAPRWQTSITTRRSTLSKTWRRALSPRGRQQQQQQHRRQQQHWQQQQRQEHRDVRHARPGPTSPTPMPCGPTPCEALPCSPVPCGALHGGVHGGA